MREALVNAIYHRSYDNNPEPTKIYLHSDGMEIISYPGPLSAIKMEHLKQVEKIPPVPARNSMIGEFLKELKFAEAKGTGIKTIYRFMKENGSAEPEFDFDEDRTYFRVTLPVHPEYILKYILNSAIIIREMGDVTQAVELLESAYQKYPTSPTLVFELIKTYVSLDRMDLAESAFNTFHKTSSNTDYPYVIKTMIDIYLEKELNSKALKLFYELDEFMLTPLQAIDSAIQAKRLRKFKKSHILFLEAGSIVFENPRALHEFAQVKILIEGKRDKNGHFIIKNIEQRKRMLRDALSMLHRVVQMDISIERKAWAWQDIGKVNFYLRKPYNEIEIAFLKAIDLLPYKTEFQSAWNRIKINLNKKQGLS